MKVLVTGANSLLGSNTVLALSENGYEVKAMVRSPEKMIIHPSEIDICLGDITDKVAVSNAVKGCEFVVHIAADTSQSTLGYERYEKVNIGGTENVLRAAEEFGVKRVIFVGSATAFAYGTKVNPGREGAKIRYPFSKAGYSKSKYEAQIHALAREKELNTEVVAVDPTFLLGEYDSKPGSGQIILRGYRKKFIFAPPGGKNFIHVKDVAQAICNALHKGNSGEAYLLANENMSYKEFYEKLAKVTGQESRIIMIPKFVLLLVGFIGNFLIKIGIPTSAHLINVKILCVENYYDSSKAKSELDLKSTPISIALKDAICWFKENGILK